MVAGILADSSHLSCGRGRRPVQIRSGVLAPQRLAFRAVEEVAGGGAAVEGFAIIVPRDSAWISGERLNRERRRALREKSEVWRM